jgi:hypothetical protein
VDLGKKPRAQLVMQPQRRRDCSLQLGRTAAALSRRARAAPPASRLAALTGRRRPGAGLAVQARVEAHR